MPLGQVAEIRPSIGPSRIDHLDRERVISVQANTEGRPLSEVVGDIEDAARRRSQLPAGYAITQGGQTQEQQEVFTRILIALGVAVLLMYLVLVVQFGSFLDPLAIMLSLPLSLIGVVGALMLTGDTLNIMSMIGVILLMGIVAKNAILLIDFAKWSEEKGLPRPRGHHRSRARAAAADSDDDVRADRRHDSGGAGRGRRRRLPRAARPRHHRRRHHVDGPDAARDSDVLRHALEP